MSWKLPAIAIVLLCGLSQTVLLGQVAPDEQADNSPSDLQPVPLADVQSSGAGAWQTSEPDPLIWYSHPPRHYAQADLLFWDRVGTGCDRPLVLDQNVFIPGEDVVLTTGDLDFDYEPGMRVLLGWRPDPCNGCAWCSAWELSYFGIFDWSAGAAVVGDNNLMLPGTIGFAANNFSGADEIRALYDSELHNVELNCVKSCCFDFCSHGKGKGGSGSKDDCTPACRTQLDVVCGFRFVTLQEDFSLIGIDDAPGQEGQSSYDVSTRNYLYGFQIGGRLRRSLPRWIVETRGKAGVFVNDAQQRQSITDFPEGFVVRERVGGSGESAAMLAELGVTLIRPITANWSLRVGYDALGIGGLALAPDQLDFTDTDNSGRRLHNDGWIFVHGAHVGLEAWW